VTFGLSSSCVDLKLTRQDGEHPFSHTHTHTHTYTHRCIIYTHHHPSMPFVSLENQTKYLSNSKWQLNNKCRDSEHILPPLFFLFFFFIFSPLFFFFFSNFFIKKFHIKILEFIFHTYSKFSPIYMLGTNNSKFFLS
jgi:hypothetical protein